MKNAHKLAKILWDFHVLHQDIHKSSCIIALGSSDIRTAQRAAELININYGEVLVCTGGFGRITKDSFNRSEAELFSEEAQRLGVPKDKIIIEDQSTNTFDNIRFTKKLLEEKGISPKSCLVVTKPYMERRAHATFRTVWKNMPIQVTSPEISFENYANDIASIELLINMLVGDHQRMIIFSDANHIDRQIIPKAVMDAYNSLVTLGYTQQMIPDENINELLAAVTAGAID